MSKQELNKTAAEIFGRYPNERTIHFTSDGVPFFKQNDADNHAKTLEDKELTEISRSDVKAVSNSEQATDETKTKEPVKAKAQTAAKPATAPKADAAVNKSGKGKAAAKPAETKPAETADQSGDQGEGQGTGEQQA